MTPGIEKARKAKIFFQVHEYTHDPVSSSYGLEAAEKMGVAVERVFKTLVVNLDGRELAVGVVPVSLNLNMKLFARAAAAKKAAMADPAVVARATGYVLGGVSPLGQKKRLKTIVHCSARDQQTVFVSAGRRGLEIELQPGDLLTLTNGTFAEICLPQRAAGSRC